MGMPRIFNIPKVITRINDVQYKDMYKELGVDIVNGTTLLVSLIRNKILESRFGSLLLEDKNVDTLEVEVSDKIAGRQIAEFNLPGECLIVAIVREKKDTVIARAQDRAERGDLLIAAVKIESLARVKKIFGLR